jgi:SPP1 gp7 family putative phage head morphogenesis protein
MPEVLLRGALPSAGVKAEYQKALTSLVDDMRASVLLRLRELLRTREEDGTARDAMPEDLESALRDLFDEWTRKFDAFAAFRARRLAQRVRASASRQLASSLREAGLAVQFRVSGRVESALNGIVAENVGLIKSLPEKALGEVQGIVMQSVRKGRDMAHIAREVESRFKVSRNRAITIARDQTNKATEAISRARYEELGIREAVWMHRSGSKVPRKSHLAMNGKKFPVADGLYDADVNLHVRPGELPNCHCTSRPLVSVPEESTEKAGKKA